MIVSKTVTLIESFNAMSMWTAITQDNKLKPISKARIFFYLTKLVSFLCIIHQHKLSLKLQFYKALIYTGRVITEQSTPEHFNKGSFFFLT